MPGFSLGKIRRPESAIAPKPFDLRWLTTDAINVAKVGVEGSNPFARSSFFSMPIDFRRYAKRAFGSYRQLDTSA